MSANNSSFKKQISDILRENGKNDRYIYHLLQVADELQKKWDTNTPLNIFITNQLKRLDYMSTREVSKSELLNMTYDWGVTEPITKQLLKVKKNVIMYNTVYNV